MFAESPISRIGRRLSRRYLRFGDSQRDAVLPVPAPGRQYLLYLHIPFCVVLCPFCSFHRVEFRRERALAYFKALRREIESVTAAGFRFGDVYIGGGTPTVMPEELIKTIRLLRDLHPLRSISTETNPDDLRDEVIEQLLDAGVNRLSVGVQSFDDLLLAEMGRLEKYGNGHDIQQRLRHIAGRFDTLNIDMIFNFPDQGDASLDRDLDILVDGLHADQVSFYPLMTAESTRRPVQKRLGRVDHSRERRMYRQISNRMQAAGYDRSTAWCFSRQPAMIDEYIIENDEYLGLGSGAFSYLGGRFYSSTFSLNHYIERAAAGLSGIVRERALSERDQMRYYLLTHLFAGCVDLERAEETFAGRFRKVVWPELTALEMSGSVSELGTRLLLTERGYYFWVVLMREFFTGVNQLRDAMRHHISAERVSLH